MDLRRQIAIVRKWLPLLVVSVLLAAGAAFLISNIQARTYEASATLNVGQSLTVANPDYTQILTSQRLSTTYAALATMRPTAAAVIAKLDLGTTADELLARVTADAPTDSTLVTIAVRDTDADRAAAVANAFAEQLIAESPAIAGRQTDILASVDAILKGTQAQIETTQARMVVLTGLAQRTPAQEAELAGLQSGLVSLRSTYATLLAYSSNSSPNLVRLVDPAVSPASPVSPRPLLNVILGAIFGLLIAIGIVVIAEVLIDSIKDSDDLQEASSLSTLGTIARMKSDGGRSEIYQLATILYPRSRAAEGYRTLRTNIEFAAVDAPLRTLLITSAAPGEGKTVTASNLAVVFAQSGRRVLLVDADLRKPGIDRIFNLPNEQGLTTLLRGDGINPEALLRVVEQGNLQLLTTGPLPPNPAELLGSQRMRGVIERLSVGADLVIFDSPPLQAVSDAAILSSFADGTIVVVDVGRSRRRAVRQARQALARAGANVLGAVLNRVPEGARVDQYGYYGSDGGRNQKVDPASPRAGESAGPLPS